MAIALDPELDELSARVDEPDIDPDGDDDDDDDDDNDDESPDNVDPEIQD